MQLKYLIALLIGAVTALFVLQNIETVSITFLFWSFQISRVLFMFLLLLAGVIIGWTLNSFYHKKR